MLTPLFLDPRIPIAAGRVPTDSTKPATAWPEHTQSPRPGLSDLLASQALLRAMELGWEAHASARSLAELAAGDQAALHRALARIQRRCLVRSTPVAERAALTLRLAFDPPASTTGGGR
jgi:hypothetical protein